MKLMKVRPVRIFSNCCKYVFCLFVCFFLFVCLCVGCQLCMGHAVDKDLLSLVQTQVKGIIKDLTLQSAQLFQAQKTAAVLQQQLSQKVRLDERDARLDAVEKKLQENGDTRREEMKIILERLGSVEKLLNEELLKRVQKVEESLALMNTEVKELRLGASNTDSKVGHLEQGLAETSGKVEQLQDGLSNTGGEVDKLKEGLSNTGSQVEKLHEGLVRTSNRVDQLEHEVKSQMMKDVKPGELNREKVTCKSVRAKPKLNQRQL